MISKNKNSAKPLSRTKTAGAQNDFHILKVVIETFIY